jgi:hypothetical protein
MRRARWSRTPPPASASSESSKRWGVAAVAAAAGDQDAVAVVGSRWDGAQITFPNNMRTMNDGMQNPVLTFTNAAATRNHPTTEPSVVIPA